MITYYALRHNYLEKCPPTKNLDPSIVWVDMLAPSKEESDLIEHYFNITLPSMQEMQEIEASSRLYSDNQGLFMTATLLAHADSELPSSTVVTFILKKNRLITLRHDTPRSFNIFVSRCGRSSGGILHHGGDIFVGLMDAVIDRLSDVLEYSNKSIEVLSLKTFQTQETKALKTNDLQKSLCTIGRLGDLNGRVRETLLSLNRLYRFFSMSLSRESKENDMLLDKVYTLSKDVTSLSDHASFLSNKINFLLDATLGLINIEQNAIIKIFSVAAVVFLPPTLIASIYGMNFAVMPELSSPLGYPLAIVGMIISALLPYLYFKRKKWL
jgi:magnesium transporter